MGNGLVGVLLPVGIAVNHPCRPGICLLPNRWPVNIDGVVMDIINSCAIVNISNVINPHRLPGILPYFLRPRPGNIGLVVVNIRIVNNGGVMYNSYAARWLGIIVVNIGPGNIALRCANPVIIGYMIPATDGYTDTDAWQ